MGTATSQFLEELAGVVNAIIHSTWENEQDSKMRFLKSIYKDTGSRVRDTDFKSFVTELSSGVMYDTSVSTALSAGDDFNQLTKLEKITRLNYKTAQFTIDRHDIAKVERILKMADPMQRMQEFARAYKDRINKYLYSAIKRRRLGLIDAFMDAIKSKTIAGTELLIKEAADVDATTDAYPFVNAIATAKGEAALDAAYNAFAIQTDETQKPIGQQEIKWMFVNQDKAGAEKLIHSSMYVNANYRNIADTGSPERSAVLYASASPDDKSIFLSEQHSIVMYGREEIPPVKAYEVAAGLQFLVDDYAVITAEASVGVVYNDPSL